MKNLDWARKAILSFSYARLDLIVWLALSTVFVSLVAIVVQVVLWLFFPGLAPRGSTTLICLIRVWGGVQMLCLAIIGSHLAYI